MSLARFISVIGADSIPKGDEIIVLPPAAGKPKKLK